MPSKGRSIVIQYVAWDTAANSGRTSDDSNHTLRVCKDGVAAAPTNTPEEIDATYAPGLYRLTLTNAEVNADSIAIAGTSSTSGVEIIPVLITTELLPNVPPGESGGVATADAAGRVDIGAVAGEAVTGTDDFKADDATQDWTDDERAQIRRRLGVEGQHAQPTAEGDLTDIKLIVQAGRSR